MSIILWIDPGTTTIGYAFLEIQGRQRVLLDWGTLKTAPGKLEEKLAEIWEDLAVLLHRWKPEKAGIERLYFTNNITNGIQVAHARGVCLLALQQRHIPIVEFTPTQVKKWIAGHGSAQKKQVQNALKFLFGLAEIPTPDDAADAIAIAYLASLAR